MRVLSLLLLVVPTPLFAQNLPGTKLLTSKDDFARVMLTGIEKDLDRRREALVFDKPRFTIDPKDPDFDKKAEPHRQRLRKILGIVDERVRAGSVSDGRTLIAENNSHKLFQVHWPVLPGLDAEGVLLEPNGEIKANLIYLPDPDPITWIPVLNGKVLHPAAFLASYGCRVLIPTRIDRDSRWSGNPAIGRQTNQTHREFIHRMAFQMGRTLHGYELQQLLAACDHFAKEKLPLGVYGEREGGLLALYAGALDSRIDFAVISGCVGPTFRVDLQPLYCDVWKSLNEFSPLDLLTLYGSRRVIFEIDGPPSEFGLPPKAIGTKSQAAPGSFKTNERLVRDTFANSPRPILQTSGSVESLKLLGLKSLHKPDSTAFPLKTEFRETSQKRQFDQLVSYTQNLLEPSRRQRQDSFWKRLDTTSIPKFEKSTEKLRDEFWENTIGKLPSPTKPPTVHTRLAYETAKWKGYEVVLNLEEDLISYGVLLIPNDIKPGEKRACVVCQHGLEGRPADVVNPKERTRAYNSFGADLADQGFIVFAPQAPYIFGNDFRQIVRKAHPLGLTLYSYIVRQHELVLAFLETLPFVDASRIAYYGLSYGGKVAMRIPAVLAKYCLSICSGDFNEWIWKNITIDWVGSYMFTHEYEIYEFNLGNTFNYAEMAALIAPRPFMVERGHNDGVGIDEWVSFEYAKVRRLYAQLKIPERTEIEYFWGGHEIHLKGTLEFLRKHLNHR